MRGFGIRTSTLYLVASVALAALAGLLVQAHAGRYAARAAAAGPDATVVVAAEPIGRGEPIRPEQLRLAPMPRAFLPPGGLSKIEDAAGRVPLAGLAEGEAVTETRLARVRAGPVASLVPRGLRAFAVPTSLPLGAIAAGDRVDLLATYAGDRPRTETVATGLEVLLVLSPSGTVVSPRTPASPGQGEEGVAGDPSPEDRGGESSLDLAAAGIDSPGTLILLVSPYQQGRLAFARSFGNLEVTIGGVEE